MSKPEALLRQEDEGRRFVDARNVPTKSTYIPLGSEFLDASGHCGAKLFHNTDFSLIGSGISLSEQLFFILGQLSFQYCEVDFGHSRHVFPEHHTSTVHLVLRLHAGIHNTHCLFCLHTSSELWHYCDGFYPHQAILE
jgi:hypothetical protein